MLILGLVLVAMAASPPLPGRIDDLRRQWVHLHSIEVTADVQADKQGQLANLDARIDAGVATSEDLNTLYLDLDKTRTWLLAHAADRPALPPGQFHKTADGWIVETPGLQIRLDWGTLSLECRTPRETWRTHPCHDRDVERRIAPPFSLASARQMDAEPLSTGYSTGMTVSLSEFPAAPGFKLRILLQVTGTELVVDLIPAGDLTDLATLAWPKAIILGNRAADLSVIPNMQGILLPGDWQQSIWRRELTQSRALYMPWWGQIRDGHGVQTLLETSDDAGVFYQHQPGGPTRIQPLWYSSLGGLRYPRVVRYVFNDASTYVRMAKRYRRYVQETGQFVSLEEKRIRTPKLNQVIGHPLVTAAALSHVVAGSRFYNREELERNHRLTTFAELTDGVRSLHDRGVGSAYVHLDGWGFAGYDNRHPDVIPPGPEQGGWAGMRLLVDTCHALGYLLVLHDQYRDFYLNAASYDRGLSLQEWDGCRVEHAEWPGGRQAFLSPRFAPGYVRRNYDAFAAMGIAVDGAYLDVFSVVPLEESFEPSRPITRSECAAYRRECFDLLRARGGVVSSEEPTDYLVRSLDLVHHGPYPTMGKGYGPGIGAGIAVPLFNLVYHDALLLPWDMSDNGGWGIPAGDAGWLHCVLNAGLPYLGLSASEAQIKRVLEIAALNARLATLEMTDHAFLDPARRRQRTTFSDGTRITVDFEKKTYSVEAGASGPPRPGNAPATSRDP